jgi:hypothetical protein
LFLTRPLLLGAAGVVEKWFWASAITGRACKGTARLSSGSGSLCLFSMVLAAERSSPGFQRRWLARAPAELLNGYSNHASATIPSWR